MELKSLHILEGVTMYEALPTLGGGEGVMEMGIVRERGEKGEGERGDAKMNQNMKDEEEVKKGKEDEEVKWDEIKLGEIEE